MRGIARPLSLQNDRALKFAVVRVIRAVTVRIGAANLAARFRISRSMIKSTSNTARSFL